MPLFPQGFIDELKAQADIVQVIQDHVPLKRAGSSFKGLCPFHAEKTPSFHVHRDRGFFHCFGCGVGGDVFKFVELHLKVAFPEAVRLVAQRCGVPVPEPADAGRDAAASVERETLLKAHEIAAAYFRDQLAGPGGARARQQLRDRGLTPQTIEALGFGYAPAMRDSLTALLLREGFAPQQALRSGLVTEREAGQLVDRFRGRLMIPICREGGSIVAFGGRACDPDQQPKYLNSPETAVYSKGRTLYGLHLAKDAIRRLGYAVLVEGYFDFAQAWQAGVTTVVASCGTALTSAQAQLLRRVTGKVVLSFDPDTAGQGAAARSCELLVSEGFQVNVALLPAGEDPDTFVRRHGGAAYVEKLRSSRPYLEFLLARTAAQHDFSSDDSRRGFLTKMLATAALIPDPAQRDQFADRLAHKARITEEVVRAEIRKAAAGRRTVLSRELPALGQIRPAEKGLIWGLMRDPATAMPALEHLDPGDLEALTTGPILQAACALAGWPAEEVPQTLLARLKEEEAGVVSRIAQETASPAPPLDCVRALKRLSYERERARLQEEIDRLQQLGTEQSIDQIGALWERKKALLQRLEALNA